MAQSENASADAQANVTYQRGLSRDDELRFLALQLATRDAASNHEDALTAAKAYYAWLAETPA